MLSVSVKNPPFYTKALELDLLYEVGSGTSQSSMNAEEQLCI